MASSQFPSALSSAVDSEMSAKIGPVSIPSKMSAPARRFKFRTIGSGPWRHLMILPSLAASTRTTTIARYAACDSLTCAASSSRGSPSLTSARRWPSLLAMRCTSARPAGGPSAPASQPIRRLRPPSPWEPPARAARPGPLMRCSGGCGAAISVVETGQ